MQISSNINLIINQLLVMGSKYINNVLKVMILKYIRTILN
jgi:hypothetical protein